MRYRFFWHISAPILLALPLWLSAATPRPLVWDDLLPDSWRPDPELVRLYQEGEIGEDDPRIIAFRELLQDPNPPVNTTLDGQYITLSGYVVPLESHSSGKVESFLLVPFIGACIHVPPPPANQQLYLTLPPDRAQKLNLFDWVEVEGVLTTESIESEFSSVGYQMQPRRVTRDESSN
ncbi:DUF3299 domain-containing protein [Ectothiorhodospiraceae bacterium BW-2]|nr:DUF3299 domain-containing protein [Ectothiorhodospiraceae bacterium BW-2]